MALFFGLNQAESLHVEEVAFHPVNLILGHAATLQVDGESGEMRRSSFALSRRSVAIVTAKFFLNLHGSHGGVHLNLFVKAVVVSLREILNEVTRPRTAVAPRRIEARVEAQCFAGDDGLQRSTGLQRFEFIIVLNARQFEPVDLGVLY